MKHAVSFGLLATTTAALAGTALAGTAPPPKEAVKDPKALEALYDSPLAKEFADGKYFPTIDELDPGPDCKSISAGRHFSLPLYEQSIAGVPFTVGLAGDIGLVADTDKFGAEATLGPSVDMFGQSFRPLDLRLSAVTKSSGESTIDASLYAFGMEITTRNLASTTDPIEYIDGLGWSLPHVFNGQLGDSYGCSAGPLENCTVAWSLRSNVAASVGAIIILRVSAQGVEARTLAAINADASVSASGTLTTDVVTDVGSLKGLRIGAEGFGRIDVIHTLFGGRALLMPYNSYYVADAAASLAVTDTMQGSAKITFPVPIIDDPTFTLFQLNGTGLIEDWRYQCTFPKQF